MSEFRRQFLTTSRERQRRTGKVDPKKMGPVTDREFEEGMLAHFDELGDRENYLAQLKRMRDNGMEPRGIGRPLPGSPYYDYGRK